MNILVLAKGYPPTIGGVENYSKYISEGLSIYHNIRVLTFSPHVNEGIDNCSDNLGVVVKRIKPSQYELFNGFLFLIHYIVELLKRKPDLIVATTWKIALPCAILQFLFNIPFTLTAHGAEVTRIRNNRILMRLMQFVFGKAKRVVSVSSFTNNIVKEFSQVDPQKCKVVSNGIDMNPINRIEINRAKKIIGFSDSSILLSVSRLDKRKGHAEVIKALPNILKDIPDLHYIIVGNGPEKENLKMLAHKLGLNDTVVFTGYVSDEELPNYYSACDVFIMLNTMQNIEDFEGFGFVFAEAGAYAKPAIAGDNSGPREVIEDEVSGYLVDPFDHELIAKRVIDLFKNKPLKQSMGNSARQRVENNFTVDTMVSSFNKVLSSTQ